jgi:hypothetical protein
MLIVIMATALALLFTRQPNVRGQSDGILPWIVNTSPGRGDELPIDQGITFTLNTPMNRASVEAAFNVSPAAPGTFRWLDDTTFTYTPTKPLDRQAAYIFTIDSSARSHEGTGLRDTFSLKLHTTGYLTITQFLPQDEGYALELQPTITVVFNRPVVPLGTAEQMQNMPVPFKSTPEIVGSGQWLTTSIYSFKPTTLLKEDTDYKITFPTTLTDVSGSRLKEDISFKFKTIRKTPVQPKSFSIHYISPEDKRTGTFRTPLIRIGFDGPADVPTAEAGFSLIGPGGRIIPGKFKWKAENNELQFRPGEILDHSTTYTIKIDRKNIRSKTGLPLTTSATVSFTTMGLPQIVNTSPADGSLVDPAATVMIGFSNPMKLDDLTSRIEVSPKVPTVVLDSDIGPDSMSARVQFSTLPSTIYTITLNTKGLVDIWGAPIQVDPKANVYKIIAPDKIQFRYVTGALGPAVSLETAGQGMGLYNAYHQTRVFVTHRNINTVGMTLYNISLPLFLNASNNGSRARDELETLIRRWVIPVYNPQNIMRYDLLAITTNGTSIGQQGNVICIEAAPSILAIGQRIRVVRKEIPRDETATPTAPAPINVRHQPGTQNTAIIGQAANGITFDVLDGPVCADRYVWWKVKSEDGKLDGWIPEGDLKQPYVIPLTETVTPVATNNPTLPATATPSPTATATTANTTTTTIRQLSVKEGELAPGIYRLEMEAPDITNNKHHISHVMLVATDNITLKVAQHEALAWVTDLKSGLPSPGLPVQFYRMMQLPNQQKMLPYGRPVITDRDGIARLPVREDLYPGAELIYAAISSGGHFALAASTWVQGIDASDFQQPTMFNTQDMALYLYTDRRLYRPGDKVYFRGTIRNRHDASYHLSEKKLIPVDIIDPFDQTIYSKKLPVNEYGSFSDSFTLDSGGQLGEYRIIARPNKPDPKPTGTPTTTPSGRLTPTPTSPPIPVEQFQASQQPNDPQFVTQITVAHYTPPEFRVTVKPQVPHVAPGDTIQAVVESSYYFGGPVSDAAVQWTVRTDPYYFHYTGSGNYSFEDYNQDYIAQDYEDDRPQNYSSGTGRTDEQGRYTIQLPATLGKSRRSIIYTIEALVWDQSQQMVAERGQIVVNQGQFRVGVGVENYVGQANEAQKVRLIAINNNSEPLPNTYLDVRVVRRIWASVQTIEPGTGRTIWQNELVEQGIGGGLVRTDSSGKGNFEFVPRQGGAYKIYASARDSKDNLIKSSTFIWISGKDYVAWRAPNSNRIDLQTDKTGYKVGETATLLIPTPFQGPSTALITVERNGILKKEVLTLHSNSTIYKLPITPDMAPNAFVSVIVIKGEDENNFTAAFRTGLLQLNVDAEQLHLQISVTSDRQKAGPREQVTFKIHAANHKGEPVQAEVGLALVDEAIIALMPDDLPSLMAYFYSRQGLGVRTANSLIFNIDQTTQEIINVQKGGGKGGSDYTGIFTLRQNFITTPLWAPSVITDANGDATVTVTLPDQLTTFILDARAYTLPMGDTNTTLVGQTAQSLVSTRPLLIRPEVPRFYVVGDSSILSAIVNNNTDEEQQVAVSLDITGAKIYGDLVQYATIPANKRLKFDWPMTVLDTNGIDMSFKVVTKDGRYGDAAKPVTGQGDNKLVPVLRYETPDTVTTGGVIGTDGGIRTEGVLIPSFATNLTGTARDEVLQIRVERSLSASATAALKTLKIFPYYCIEQTVSRFLPDAVMFRAQKKLGLNDRALLNELSETLETALQRIYSDQHVDGGWGWFIGDRSDQLVSAYTVLGLAEVKAAGWQVDTKVFFKAVDGLRRSLKNVDDKTPSWDLNRQAFILYVLARASQVDVTGSLQSQVLDATAHPSSVGPTVVQFYDVSRSVKLFDQRDRMNLDALAFLAMDFAIIEPTSSYHTVPIMDRIKKAAKYTLTGRHWEESNYDYWNWTTDIRTTAIVLKALIEIEPSSPLIPDAVRWLMTARKFDSWETTQETAWSVMALTAWMQQSGDLTPNYTFDIALNQQPLTSGETATAENVRVTHDLRVSVSRLLSNQINRIAVQRSAGMGTLYYSAQLKTYLPVEQVKALSRGLFITRTYSLANDKNQTPIKMANVGDQIRVTLTIVVPETLNYVVIEDPIPAGTQSINTSFQTAQRLDKNDPLRYGWTHWVFTHKELRDDRTVLYAPYLPKGTYQFIYQLRAGAAGTYHVMPANGHTFYMPGIFGRSDGQLFTLLPPDQAVF